MDGNGSIRFFGDSDEKLLQLKETALSIRSKIKLMFSVGSKTSDIHFSRIVAEKNKRRFLINSIVSFLDENDLDGVDVYWTWPYKKDRRSYVQFLRELKKSLADLKIEKKRTEEYIISIIVPQNPSEFKGFNLVEIMESVDFINVLTNDFYSTTHKVGPRSPLYGGSEGSVDETMEYLSCKTENSRKLNLGVSFYGNRFLKTDLPFGNNSIWIPMGSETKGPYIELRGYSTSDEKAITKWDNISRTPYIWNDRNFLTFENERNFKTTTTPLSATTLPTSIVPTTDCKTSTTPLPPTTTTTFQSTTTSRQLSSTTTSSKNYSKLPQAASCGKRIVGYFTGFEDADLREEQLKKLTHVIYLFATVQDNGSIKLDNGLTEKRFLDLKDKAHSLRSDLKVMIGVGGADRFTSIVSDDGKRKILIDSITSFIDEHDLDGVELFWNHSKKKDKHSKFVRELREALNNLKSSKKRAEDYLISTIVSPYIDSLEEGYYINEILESVDFLNVLTFDYLKTSQVGPQSPIYGGTRGNIDETMKYLTCKTRQPSKINMAIPFYGTFWRNASLPFKDDSVEIWMEQEYAAGPFSVNWRELEPNGWDKNTTRFHEKSKTSYIWYPETGHFLTFEDERSLAEKAKYVKEHQLGGILIWAIDMDDDADTLLSVVSLSDICSQKEKDYINYICHY
ncbi:unnamed protein product [Caenorhabditis nigoni]